MIVLLAEHLSEPLQAVLREAEDVAAAAAVNSSGVMAGSALLAAALTVSRTAVGVGRAVAALQAAVSAADAVTDLPTLRSALELATAVGADAADPETFGCGPALVRSSTLALAAFQLICIVCNDLTAASCPSWLLPVCQGQYENTDDLSAD